MFTAFSTALSALSAHTTAIDVTGNNLANLNTTGFKTSVVSFAELVTQSMNGDLGQTQVGFGVARPATIRQFSQGAIKSSSGDLDVAIRGDGFLIAKESSGNIVYTRGGNLRIDDQGRLQTANGQRIQGWAAIDGKLATGVPPGDIVIPIGSIKPPSATSSISFDLNLNATAAASDTFSTSIEVFDSLGKSHVMTVSFTKTAANTWNYALAFPDADVTSPVAPLTGSLSFNAIGQLIDPPSGGPFPVLTVPGLISGGADLKIEWNLYDAATPRLTQYAQPSAVSANQQNGSAPAQLLRVTVADEGALVAQFSNGAQRPVGQLAMASIRNPESLLDVGDNNYALTARSALPAVGLSGSGGRGSIVGGAVESSITDIAHEFTNLIVLQRGYQANAKVITTADEITQETIGLKR